MKKKGLGHKAKRAAQAYAAHKAVEKVEEHYQEDIDKPSREGWKGKVDDAKKVIEEVIHTVYKAEHLQGDIAKEGAHLAKEAVKEGLHLDQDDDRSLKDKGQESVNKIKDEVVEIKDGAIDAAKRVASSEDL